MFDADRPITSSTQDKLNRAIFAKYLARCLLDYKDPACLVVGLYGGFGVGKTSVINLVLEELNFASTNLPDDEKPIILNFNPWGYSGQNQLIYSFFRRLSSTLRRADNLQNKERIVYLLELYISFYTQKPVPKALTKKRSLLQKLTFRENKEVYAWESGQDLTIIKSELNDLLKSQKQKIIVIIDNISQLYDHEINQIFQIVKTIGDYANTAYLLAFDKSQVIKAVNRLNGGGEAFLEKIVQMPFEIPPILLHDVEKIFADRLTDIMPLVPEDAWNTEYWSTIYYSSLRFFFDNVRDITRYINTLNFSYPRIRDVVNPVDFFALTAIEVFIPQVYFGIRDNKDLFTDLLDHVYLLDENQIEKDKMRCNEILSRSKKIPREILLDMLLNLFPRLRRLYQPDVMFYHSDSIARKLRRICSPDLFDVYFRLSMHIGKIPHAEFETILSMAADPEAFDHALTRLNQDDKINEFLDMLDSKFISTIPLKNIQAIVSALLDNGDLFPQGINGPLTLDISMRIHRIIHGLLQRFKNTDDRFLILQNAIANSTKSLHILVFELKEQSREHMEEADTYMPIEYRDLLPDQLESLRKLVVSRIKNWVATQRLIDHPQLLSILYAWKEWGSDDECNQFVAQMTKTDPGLIAFLVNVFKEPISEVISEYHKNPFWEKYLETIQDFIPIKAIEPHAKTLFEDNYFEKLREKEQLALMIFLDLTKAQTKKFIPKTTVD